MLLIVSYLKEENKRHPLVVRVKYPFFRFIRLNSGISELIALCALRTFSVAGNKRKLDEETLFVLR